MIRAKQLIDLFRQAFDEHWGYIYGASGETWTQAKQDAATREQTKKYGQKWVGRRVADCSGLFYWAFKQLGGYCYHGSNTMWKKYCSAQGVITSETVLKPGTAVFKYNTTNDYHHVGLYVGSNTVIEAKGTAYGVISSPLSGWSHWGELKGIDYSEQEDISMELLYKAIVSTSGAKLNLRSAPVIGKVISKLVNGSRIDVYEEKDGWLHVRQNDLEGWVSSEFTRRVINVSGSSTLLITDSEGNTFSPVGSFTVKAVNG